jgi:arsenate reductase
MKFSFSKLTKQKEEKSDRTVLFVCVENAGRSQMAEGFFESIFQEIYDAKCWNKTIKQN